MEPIVTEDIVTLDDGKEYEVIETIDDNGSKYLYLARNEENLEILLAKEIINEDGSITLKSLNDANEIDRIFGLIAEKLKQE